jgi:hypothetical protein
MNARSRLYCLAEQIALYLAPTKYCYRYQQRPVGQFGISLRFEKDEIQIRPTNLCRIQRVRLLYQSCGEKPDTLGWNIKKKQDT